MDVALGVLAIAVTVLVVTGLAERFALTAPLVLMLVGILASFVPVVPTLQLDPEVVLYGLLPPLLYATAIRTAVSDFRSEIVPIAYLSVLLVVVTSAVVGLLVWWLLPVPYAAAFAVGAVVAPPDAVAATAVARKVGLPRRLVTILEGESLVNDATAITCLRMAIVALGASVTIGQVVESFLLAAVGGVLIGLAVALVVGAVRRFVDTPVLDTGLSFTVPFLAYLPAEKIHSSGVVAVVTAGLLLGHKAPLLQSAQSRVNERVTWGTVAFLLENAVFLLVGLQAQPILEDVRASDVGLGRGVLVCLSVLATVVVLRLIWLQLGALVLFRVREDDRREPTPPVRGALVVGWAGMRGVVTLAAGLLLPPDTPQRPLLLMVAMTVTAGTLLLHGLTLGLVARRLDLTGPDPREDALQTAAVLHTIGSAALASLPRLAQDGDSEEATDLVRQRIARRGNAIWESLGRTGGQTPSGSYRRLRTETLGVERAELLRLRREGKVEQAILADILESLDIEESMLSEVSARLEPDADRPLKAKAPQDDLCEHLREAPWLQKPSGSECADCLAEGTETVHLRMCLDCGYVACCDSSPARHAERHHRDSGHPVMRSIEPGEHWRWCYVDDVLG